VAKYLVIDNGGTFIKPSLMDENGNILEMLPKIPTQTMDRDQMNAALSGQKGEVEINNGALHSVEGYLAIIDRIAAPLKGEIDGIAMSFPGVIDSDRGYCYSGGSFFFAAGQEMGRIMTEHFGVPVTLENDGKCAALAEYWKGSLKGVKNGAAIVLGTGVAGGVIVNGELVRGSHFSAGELSFMLSDLSKPLEMGSYFSTCGAGGICGAVAYLKGLAPSEVDGFKVFEMAKAGDPMVLGVLGNIAKQIAGQIYNMTTLLDLDCVAIGGGISREPMWIEMIQAAVAEHNEKNPLKPYSAFCPQSTVKRCTFFNEANMVGALYHHLKLRGILPVDAD
jgi:predicted NBD/HSP70 family sugar kinase